MNHLAHNITPGFLLRFTLPSIVMMVFNAFYTIVDGGFVSNFVGTGALSAVNIVYPTQSLTLAIGIMLATGGSAVCAGRWAKGMTRVQSTAFPYCSSVVRPSVC